MRTARTTVLLTDTERAELDAFATSRGESVSNVVRDATVRYMAQPPEADASEAAALDLLLDELEAAIPKWNAKFDSMEANLDRAHNAVREALKQVEETLR